MIATLFITLLLLRARLFGEPFMKIYSPGHVEAAISTFLKVALIICAAAIFDRPGRPLLLGRSCQDGAGSDTPRLVQDLVTVSSSRLRSQSASGGRKTSR